MPSIRILFRFFFRKAVNDFLIQNIVSCYTLFCKEKQVVFNENMKIISKIVEILSYTSEKGIYYFEEGNKSEFSELIK